MLKNRNKLSGFSNHFHIIRFRVYPMKPQYYYRTLEGVVSASFVILLLKIFVIDFIIARYRLINLKLILFLE